MARSEITLDGNWQKIADRRCIITILDTPSAHSLLYLNNSATDTAATKERPDAGEQYAQISFGLKETWAKGIGYTILVDEDV